MTDKQFKEIRELLRDIYEVLLKQRDPDIIISWEEDKEV